MRLKKHVSFSYGEYINPCPERTLALAVIERTILDAIGNSIGIPDHHQKAARAAIEEPPNNLICSFYWWLSCVFDDPDGVREAIHKALITPSETTIRWGLQQRHKLKHSTWLRRKDRSCVTNLTEYNAH